MTDESTATLRCPQTTSAEKTYPRLDAPYLVVDLTEDGKIVDLAETPDDLRRNDVYRTRKMVFKRIPAGIFMMGAPKGETGRYEGEYLHEVELKNDFYMAVFQCTQRQYQLVTGYNPIKQKSDVGGVPAEHVGDTLPVGNVSWHMARGGTWPGGEPDRTSFMGRLRYSTREWMDASTREKWRFDLPTEAQWEYACRAGVDTAFNNGTNCQVAYETLYEQELNADQEDSNLERIANYRYNTFLKGKSLQEVGLKHPNRWGLYDMHGNVWEWCLDLHEDYPKGRVLDPVGASQDSESVARIKRGGCGNTQPYRCRAAYRSRRDPMHLFVAIAWGMRVVLAKKMG